jgi:hypothetical protein
LRWIHEKKTTQKNNRKRALQVKLSDRNVVELVAKLKTLSYFDGDELLHSTNGREYITRQRLREEVSSAVDAAGGRLPLVDLPSVLGVDLAHCQRAAQEAVTSSHGKLLPLSSSSGELLTTGYFDGLAAEVAVALGETGMVDLAILARRVGLGVDLVRQALQQRSSIHGGRLEGGVLYTDAYRARVKASLRGTLRGATTPLQLHLIPVLRKDTKLTMTLVDELLAERAVAGKVSGAQSALWLPESYIKAQHDVVRLFYQNNGFVTFDMATKHGISNAVSFLSMEFPDGVVLSKTFVSPSIVHEVNAALEEAEASGSWFDVCQLQNEPEDAAMLAKMCVSQLFGKDAVLSSLFLDTYFVSPRFLESLRSPLFEEARRAGLKAEKKSEEKPLTGEKEKSGKKERSGKGGGRSKKKAGAGAGANANVTHAMEPSEPARPTSLSLEAIEAIILAQDENLEGDSDLVKAIAAELRPAVLMEYDRVVSEVFANGLSRRRELRDAARNAFQRRSLYLQAHAKGVVTVASKSSAADAQKMPTLVARHILRALGPDCIDALLFFCVDNAENELGGSVDVLERPLDPRVRKEAVANGPSELGEVLSALSPPSDSPNDVLGGFLDKLQDAAGAVGLQWRRLDTKESAAVLAQHIQSLEGRLSELVASVQDAQSDDSVKAAPEILAMVVPYLAAKRYEACITLPGKALLWGLEALKEGLGEHEYAALIELHGGVVELLKAGASGAGAHGNEAIKRSLPAVADLVRRLQT